MRPPSNTASTSPADRDCAAAITSAATASSSAGVRSPVARSAAQARSRTGTGSSSPAMATSMAAFSSLAFVPKPSSTVGTATPAAPAIARIVAPA